MEEEKIKEKTKLLKVALPLTLWEDFYYLFPGQGERTRFLRLLIEIVVRKNFSLAMVDKKEINKLLDNFMDKEERKKIHD